MKFIVFAACFWSLFAVHCAAAPAWTITDRIHVGGEGGWDYLTFQPETNRLFVSNAKQVVVIDLKTKAIIGSIEAAQACMGLPATDLGCGFISNGADGTVTVFDLNRSKVITKLTVGGKPDAICSRPVTKKVFAFNGKTGVATAIDAVKKVVLGEIPLGGSRICTGRGHGAFDALEDKSEIVKINASTQAKW